MDHLNKRGSSSLISSLAEGLRKLFPSTFSIAIALTVITFILALWLTTTVDFSGSVSAFYQDVATDPLSTSGNHFLQLLGFWYKGMWNPGLLAFAIQMMLILVLGYVLASTAVFRKLMFRLLVLCSSTAKSAFLVTLITLLVSLFNWGLGLIFGAIFARKVGEYASSRNRMMNYPLVAAAGYSGLMVWHGGISGSAPLKVAEQGHFLALVGKDIPAIDMGQTTFSTMNILIALVLLIVLPAVMYWIGRKNEKTISPAFRLPAPASERLEEQSGLPPLAGAERIDYSRIAGIGLGIALLAVAAYKAVLAGAFSVLDPNYLNFILLGFCLLFSGTIAGFLKRVGEAMEASAGILIQFPLYFGIMGIMKYSGLVALFSESLINISTVATFPLFTFISAALVNIFVPSGGGQWVVQGPIIVEAAQNLGASLPKAVMALAYGDQVTNMLQPFWALPLLGITGLKPKDILPYTLLLMGIGTIIFMAGLLVL